MNNRLVLVVAVVAVLVLGVGGGLVAALVVADDDPAGRTGDTGGSSPTGPPPAAPSSPSEPTPSEPVPTEPAGPVPDGLESFYTQQPTWEPCGSNECAALTVPLAYAEPDGETIDIALERTIARDTGNRVGSLVVNPGGPGAPGTTMAENAGSYFPADLLDRMDVVAFDPRGTGDSAPVDCLPDAELDAFVAQDPTPDDAAEIEEYLANQEEFFAGCVAGSDGVAGHVSTVEAARDMDVLRAVLGEEQLSYLGFSYGTTLGSTYAELFPANVGRFVLDGATDPTLDFRENSLSQAAGFQTALEAYLDDCVAGGDCFLGSTRDEALTTIADLFTQIEDSPLPTNTDRDLQIGNAFYGVAYPLYSRDSWEFLDKALEEAVDGNGTTMLVLADLYASRDTLSGDYTDNSLEAFGAINCLDDPTSIPGAEVPAEYPAFDEASPTFGRFFAWGLAGCHGVQDEAAEPTPTITGAGAAPIVVIGTTRDPATPYEEAVALAEQLESGVLLSRDGDGHTAYNKGNACIDDAVEAYLFDGTVPADGTEC